MTARTGHSWFSWVRVLPTFRFSTRQRFVVGRWLRVLFLAAGVVVASMTAAGETWRMRAQASNSMSEIVLFAARAAAVNPLSASTREMAATLPAQMAQVPPMLALVQLRQALEDAPISPLLLWWFAATRLRAGDAAGARETMEVLETVAPAYRGLGLLRRSIEGFERRSGR